MAKVLKSELFKDIPAIDEKKVDDALAEALKDFPKTAEKHGSLQSAIQTLYGPESTQFPYLSGQPYSYSAL